MALLSLIMCNETVKAVGSYVISSSEFVMVSPLGTFVLYIV